MSTMAELTQALGAVAGVEDGAAVTLSFGDDTAEARAVREGAGLSDLSHRGLLRLAGADHRRFLQAMATSDVNAATPGHGVYGALLNDKGRVVSDFTCFADEDALWLDVEAQAREKLPAVFDRYIIMDDVRVDDMTPLRTLLAVHGPSAARVVGTVLATEIVLENLAHRRIDAGRLVRHDRAGEPGYELWLDDAARAPRLFGGLRDAGARPVGSQAMERLRIKAGVPRAFHDADETTILLEAGMEHVLSREKGCYLGQEVIVRAQDRGGIRKQLRGLAIAGDANAVLPGRGDAVKLAEKDVGRVTSSAISPMLGRPVALAIVTKDAWELGTQVVVAGRPAKVVALPFWPAS